MPASSDTGSRNATTRSSSRRSRRLSLSKDEQARNNRLDTLSEAEHGAKANTGFATNAFNVMSNAPPEQRQGLWTNIQKYASSQGIPMDMPAEWDPSMLTDLQLGSGPPSAGGMPKVVGGLNTDVQTGQMFGVHFNPDSEDFFRVDAPGAFAQTPQQVLDMQSQARRREGDIQNAYDMGLTAVKSMGKVNDAVKNLYRAREAIDDGANSGWFNKHLPAFDTATAELREVARGMGIDIINSATFGALSKEELNLALEQGLPRDLSPENLRVFINKKIVAQKKLGDALQKRAQRLMSGQGLSEIIDQDIANKIVRPENVQENDWMLLTPSEQRMFDTL